MRTDPFMVRRIEFSLGLMLPSVVLEISIRMADLIMRAVVLGEYRAERLVTPLRRAGLQVTVLGFADLGSSFEFGVDCGKLPPDLTDDTLVSLLGELDADIVIPNVNSPGQEQFLMHYANVGPHWQAIGRKMLVHSVRFATLATDKVTFHRVAERRHWPVPRGVVCDGPRALAAAAEAVGLPMIVKEARSEPHAGRRFVRDGESIGRVSSALRYPVLAQQVIIGHEFAVEMLTLGTLTAVWPVASLGNLDADCAPGRHARVEPASLPGDATAALATVVRDLVTAFGPAGPWQMDLAVSAAGELFVIELNARFGGLSNMSWMCTGLDPHVAHVDAVLGRSLRRLPQPKRIALELPVHNGVDLPPVPSGLQLTAFYGSPTYRVPFIAGYHRAILGVPAEVSTRPGGADDARDWLLRLPPANLLVDREAAVAQLDRGQRTLTRPDRPALAEALLS